MSEVTGLLPPQFPYSPSAPPTFTGERLASEATNMAKLYCALAKAQGEFPEIAKNRTVEITMKSGGKFKFRYADLQAIISATRQPMSKNGLTVIQLIEDGPNGTTILTTRLGHEAGGSITSTKTLPAPADNDPKSHGAMQTYWRRYTYSALIGVSADDDLDERDTKDEPLALDEKMVADLKAAADQGTEAYKKYWVESLDDKQRQLLKALHPGMKKIAAEADKAKEAA